MARALGFTLEPERSPEAEARRAELSVLWDLASLLHKRRVRRGALELDVPEARIVLDPKSGAPVAVTQRAMDPGVKKAYRLVEELMLLANECVAAEAERRTLPVIYRVHGAPDPEKIERFAAVAAVLGLTFDPEDALDPKKLARFLRKAVGHPKKAVLDGLLLRSLQQACYDTVNIGHFGLASRAYLHFTSPIRRYPDLVVHRLLRAALRGERPPVDEAALRAAAALASSRERGSMDVERQVADLYRSIYMQGHLGARFEAVVVAVGPMGLYARIAEPFVDVLVRMESLGTGTGADEFEPDELGLALVGLRSGERIELGATLEIAIEDVSLVRRQVYARRIVAAGAHEARGGRRGRGHEARPAGRAPGKAAGKAAGKAPGKTRGTKKTRETSGGRTAREDRHGGRGRDGGRRKRS
ncbi:MAG: RNB domain-containing ribonuclease [Myxococcales bacterium]|nr:RNB domain-containing ribonuclease [Myxococcales bacterium]